MADEAWLTGHRPPLARQPTPGERIFEFVRTSDGAPMACELRFHGEAYGWEVQFLERGELFASRGAFPTREQAVQWAKTERYAIEGEPCGGCHGSGWVCEAHPDQLADHDPNCSGPALACPCCQPQTPAERPRMPGGWRSVLDDN
jgi:hypothetical protein